MELVKRAVKGLTVKKTDCRLRCSRTETLLINWNIWNSTTGGHRVHIRAQHE